ncbi:hypothetical protein JB92DRAFT_1518313 [Gautieria morchelliformis]|nr:hypothetical protein JB92DRAFT_1518313 [Gautieria morchelliformis]
MILTTGIQNAPVVCRLELRTFLQDQDVTNLYILATDQMMRIKQDDLSSWFQLAAIHGRPYIPFDGVGVKGSFGGYCTHSSILFPSWHRPYLALFEQSLSKHVHEIAREYKDAADKERYLKAADRFRLPYWDWATEPTLPDIIAIQETVNVHLPNGSRASIKNPLFGYYFNPVYSDFGDGLPDEKTWEAWQSTYRYPTTTDAKAKSEPSLMQSTLKNNRLTLRDRTYNILTQIKDYGMFSHDASSGNEHPPAGFDSIEAIHNQIHGLTGRNGHMGVVDYAAFDPVFWMHHANVDRLFAMWQCLNPDAYVTPLKSEAGTFTRKPGEIENVESPLTPFRRTPDKFWKSNEVRDTKVFCYTYPELSKLDSVPAEEGRLRLSKDINRLYGPTVPAAQPVPKPLAPPASVPAPVGKGPSVPELSAPGPQTAPLPKATEKGPGSEKTTSSEHKPAPVSTSEDQQSHHEWLANIAVEKYAVKSTFFVHIFLGDIDDDHKKWGIHPNLVGTHVVFANNAEFTGCERCRHAHEKKKVVTGTIPLTGCLGTRLGGIYNLAPDKVTPYLQKNLHWRVQKHDGSAVDLKDVPSLKVSVGHAVAELSQTAHGFTSWGDIQLHAKVTRGRIGGA